MDTTHLADFSDQALAGVLRELGWTKAGRFLVNGNRHTLWTKEPIEDVRAAAEARDLYL